MKDPLTKSYFTRNVQSLVSERRARKNLEKSVTVLAVLEKNLLSSPLDKVGVDKMNIGIKTLKTLLNKLKKPAKALHDEKVKLLKALKAYVRDHNDNIVGRIKAETVGSVPGGTKALAKRSVKELTPENTEFREKAQRVKQDGTALLQLHSDYRQRINISSKTMKAWDHAIQVVKLHLSKVKSAGPNERKAALKGYKTAVADLANVTRRAQKEIVAMQKDTLGRVKADAVLTF